jgi:hypothetical protein
MDSAAWDRAAWTRAFAAVLDLVADSVAVVAPLVDFHAVSS